MSKERLKLTFSGLCVLLFKGDRKHPTSMKVIVVDATKCEAKHVPRISFRATDIGLAYPATNYQMGTMTIPGANDPVDIRIDEDGQEVIDLDLPIGSHISVSWNDTVSSPKRFSLKRSMKYVADFHDFHVTKVHEDGTNTAATVVTLPYGKIKGGPPVRLREGVIKWRYEKDSGPLLMFSNSATLESSATKGSRLSLTISVGGKDTTYEFQRAEGDGHPIHIAFTNLPQQEKLIEPGIQDGAEPPHLRMYRMIAKEINGDFRPFHKAGMEECRQGAICPAVQFYE